MIKALSSLLLLVTVACGQPAPRGSDSGEAPLPTLTGRVVDAAGLLPPETEARLSTESAAVEREVGPQYVVVTVPDLHGEAIEHFGVRLGRGWGIGHRGRDDGLLLIVAPHERKVRIEVGYGLERRVTDPFADRVIREDMLPRLRTGDYPGAILAGSDALVRRLRSRASDSAIAAEDRMVA